MTLTIVTFLSIASAVIIVTMRNHRAEQTTKNLMALLLAERKKQGLSHQTLADAAGIHRSTISLIETGKRVPTILVCLKLAMALGVSLDVLLKKASKKD